MSLLEIITKSAADAESSPKTPSPYPIILNPDPIFPLLKPQIAEEELPSPVQRVEGWRISDLDSRLISLSQKFFKRLKRKLKNPSSHARAEFVDLLNSFLDQNGERVGLPIEIGPSNPDYTRRAIEKLGFLLGRDVAGLVLNACVELDLWEVVEALIVNGVVTGRTSPGVVEKMVERRRADSLSHFVKHVADIRSSDLHLVLKYFLSPAKDVGLACVRKEWESQALSAIEKASEGKKSPMSTRAAVLLAAAYDGFSAPELCLHYLFGSENVDELALSAALAGLGGQEMLRLVRYLGKWLKKYERFPDAAPCKSAASLLGLEACRWVPSLDSIVRCLGVVLDEHFSYLVLNPEFHEELMQIEGVVRSLESEAGLCSSVGYVIENLRLDAEIH